MAAIQESANKPVIKQKNQDHSRIMAGHMLTFDYLVQRDMAERQIARKVVRKSLIRSAGCLTLPLTILYFGAYVTATRLHEDITNVFFLESGMRNRVDHIFGEANTAEDLWEALRSTEPGKFLKTFFDDKDMFGINQTTKGLVGSYNQIQGAVRFSQSRLSPDKFGQPYNCTEKIACQLCHSNKGFQTIRSFTDEPPVQYDCGDGNSSRRLLDEAEAPARRLSLVRPELRTAFMPETKDEEEQFRFWLYPAESTKETQQRLDYYWQRGWIDPETSRVTITMYIMNAELGRTRLEELKIIFYFSEAGSVYYGRALQTIFLQFWQSGLSMLADFSFFVILALTSGYRLHGMWKAFVQSKLFVHLMNLGTAWEWLLILIGWWNIYGFYRMIKWEGGVKDALLPLRNGAWKDEDALVNFFDIANEASVGLSFLRVVYAQYSVVLMFRFFVSFGTQPRLAIVLKTMRNVLTDVFHFLFVFLPTFAAYVISGNLMFGRRVETFATMSGSLGACLRIAMESEYEWGELSEEYFYAAALWTWSFMLLIVLLFLNMVVAIILDIYNETREGSFPGEAIWDTMSTMILRTWRCRTWIPDKQLETFFTTEIQDQAMVSNKDIQERFNGMPARQMEQFFTQCRTEMKWEAAKDLSKKNFLKLAGTVMDALEDAHGTVRKITEEQSGNPLQSWVLPMETDEKKKVPGKHQDDIDHDNFLVSPINTKGGKAPLFQAKKDVKDAYSGAGPDWLKETWTLLKKQREWIAYTNWTLEQMQWQIQQAHESKFKEVSSTPAAENIL